MSKPAATLGSILFFLVAPCLAAGLIPWLIVYGALFWLACHVFVVAYEEKRLERVFGLQYQAFRTGVPRWIPRIRPWKPG